MPISGSQQALMVARSGIARAGATRSGYFNERIVFELNGVDYTSNIEKGSWEIRRTLTADGNSATVRVFDMQPDEGDVVVLGNGAINHREFAGTIVKVNQEFQLGKTFWRCECLDWMRQLNKAVVSKRYTSQAAHLIILDLATRVAASGFTTGSVVSSSPTIDEIELTEENLGQAFQRVAARASSVGTPYRFYVDANKGLHFGPAETAQAPTTIVQTLMTNLRMTYAKDGSVRITRATVEGGGSLIASPASPGVTSIAVDDCARFSSSGGTVKSGPQRMTYTGRSTTSGPGSLTGVPASGDGAVQYALRQGDDINLLVSVDDLVAQAAIAAKEGGDGVYERVFSDRRLSIAGATEYAVSRLAGSPILRGTVQTLDRFADVGRKLTVNVVNRIVPGGGPLSFEASITGARISPLAMGRFLRTIDYSTGDSVGFTDAIRSLAGVEGGVSA